MVDATLLRLTIINTRKLTTVKITPTTDNPSPEMVSWCATASSVVSAFMNDPCNKYVEQLSKEDYVADLNKCDTLEKLKDFLGIDDY